jgi:hypothetical protein
VRSGLQRVSDRLYFRQLLSGRDFGMKSLGARQFVNLVYLVGDRDTGEALIVDPAHDVDALLGHLDDDGMRCVGMLATHHRLTMSAVNWCTDSRFPAS